MTPKQKINWAIAIIIAMVISYTATFVMLDKRISRLERDFDSAIVTLQNE
jgi:capsular polysaccharide biosynthesis protein